MNPTPKRFVRAAILLCLLITSTLNASGQITDTSFSWPVTPRSYLDTVTDRFGAKYPLRDLAINDTVRAHGGTINALQVSTCSSGYFQVYMEPGCGLDGTSTAAVNRRNVLCRVLSDLSSFIVSPLSSNGGKINIWVRKFSNLGGAPGSISAGTSFYVTPKVNSGLVDNVCWITINSGKDAYSNIVLPLMSPNERYGPINCCMAPWPSTRL